MHQFLQEQKVESQDGETGVDGFADRMGVNCLKYTYYSNIEVRENLRAYVKHLRELAREENQRTPKSLQQVIFTEQRKGLLGTDYVNRLVLFLRGTGCSLAKETGGCTFCGFYNATNFGVKIQDDDYVRQIHDVINDETLNFREYPIICLYNDGSMLREEEITFDTFLQITKMLSVETNIKKIVIESRVEDITEEKIRKMKDVTEKEFEIAVGFESANPQIRDLCINKNFENSIFEANSRITRDYNVSLVPLLMLKPPFLTEQEAIEDYLKSLAYLEQFHFKRIDMELPTVESHTLVYDLWQAALYRPAWLWSVVEILRAREELGYQTPIYISPMIYSVSAEAKASNCPKCDPLFYQAFEEYNKSGDLGVFDQIACSCKNEWENLLREESWEETLPERVVKILDRLRSNSTQSTG